MGKQTENILTIFTKSNEKAERPDGESSNTEDWASSESRIERKKVSVS